MKNFFTAALLGVAFMSQAQSDHHTLTVDISQFKVDTGMVFVALYDPTEKAVQRQSVALRGKTTKVFFRNVSPGTYAVRFFHDENNNRQLDKGIFGIPKEGWGCSNDVKATFGPPKFEEMLFSVAADKTIALHVK